jgi:hypothetical protein
VVILPFVPGSSTTNIIETILKRHGSPRRHRGH